MTFDAVGPLCERLDGALDGEFGADPAASSAVCVVGPTGAIADVETWLDGVDDGAPVVVVAPAARRRPRGIPSDRRVAVIAAALGGLIRNAAPMRVGRTNLVLVGAMQAHDCDDGCPLNVPEAEAGWLRRLTPTRRFTTADDVVSVVRFLASDGASYVDGITIPVDGGHTMGRLE